MQIEPSFMVGSCHRHANGYGYGTRALTDRNNPGTPSIPKYKINPDHSGPVTGSRSMSLNVTGASADKRHAYQLAQQTSGDYGKFLYPVETRVSRDSYLTMQPTQKIIGRPATSNLSTSRFGANSNQFGASGDTVTMQQLRRPQSEGKEIKASRQISSTTDGQRISNMGNTGKGLMVLDPRIPHHSKFDILAATCNSRPPEIGWSIESNIQAHNKSLDWRNSLRHSRRAVTPGASS